MPTLTVHRLLRPLLVWRARHVSERMYLLILSVLVGAKMFTRAQLSGPVHETLQSAPSHCTVPPHDCEPEHTATSPCDAPPSPPRHERAPEHVTLHLPSQMTSLAQD